MADGDRNRLVAIGAKAVEQVSVTSFTKAAMQLGVAAVLAFFLKLFIDGKFEDARWERQQQIEVMKTYRDEDNRRQQQAWDAVRELRKELYELRLELRILPEKRSVLPAPAKPPGESG